MKKSAFGPRRRRDGAFAQASPAPPCFARQVPGPVQPRAQLGGRAWCCRQKSPGSRLRPPFFGVVTFFYTVADAARWRRLTRQVRLPPAPPAPARGPAYAPASRIDPARACRQEPRLFPLLTLPRSSTGIAATRTRAPRNGQQVRRPRRTWRPAPNSKYARWKEGTESYPNCARRCFRRRGVAEPRRRRGAAPGCGRLPPRTPSHGPACSPTARPARPRVCTALVPRLLSRSRPPARPPSPLARREPASPLSPRRE